MVISLVPHIVMVVLEKEIADRLYIFIIPHQEKKKGEMCTTKKIQNKKKK